MSNPSHMLKLNLQRVVKYVDRLPLFTRLVIVLAVALEMAAVLPWWDIRAWGRLEPDLFNVWTLYRANTYPLIHTDVIHLIVNLFAVTPLVERFEAEYGTLTSLALFFGPLSLLPAVIYVGIERFLLRSNTSIMGASIWGFLLIGMEAIRAHRTTPYLVIRGQPTIPMWTTPIAVLLLTAVLMPGSSFLGHLCGLAVGYICGMGLIKLLAPPAWALRLVEDKLNLRLRVPYYVSMDQVAHGRFGVLPLTTVGAVPSVATGLVGSNQRLGPSPV